MKTLSLVVPVYNSPDLAKALLAKIPELATVAHTHNFQLVETILVDDGSTAPLSDQLPSTTKDVRIIRVSPNHGKGNAVKEGALAAKGDWVLMSDVDMSAPLTEFAQLAPHCNSWMVCGSRYGRAGMPLRRRILSRIFHLLVWLSGVKGINDSQCGFKLFKMDAMRAIFKAQKIERFAFDVELIKRVQKLNGTVAEIPITWQGDHRSSLKIFRDAPRMLWDLLHI